MDLGELEAAPQQRKYHQAAEKQFGAGRHKVQPRPGFNLPPPKRTNTTVILIPGGLTPLLQPLDRMLNKQMKRLLRGMYTKYTASAPRDSKTGKLTPPGRGAVSTWCKDAWASITPEMVKTCFKICGLTLAVDVSEDHAWCMHNFGEG